MKYNNMSKPILVIRIPTYKYSHIDLGETMKKLVNNMDDYHIIPIAKETGEVEFECYNDCKGLADIDIESMINEFKNKQ